MLRINPRELEIVLGILKTYVPDIPVWAFGSRVHGENLKPYSDLDLVLVTEVPVDSQRFAELKDAFSESELPFKVDVLDWSTTNAQFQKLIQENYLIVKS